MAIEVQTIFATGIGSSKHMELVDPCREWFKDTQLLLSPEAGFNKGFKTSLQNYGFGKAKTAKIPESPELDLLKEIIIKNATEFLVIYGYDISKYDIELANIWLNEVTSEGFQPAHQHYGKAISGCFYIDVPEGCPNIVFTGPRARIDKCFIEVNQYTVFNSGTWTIVPEQGTMLLWESYLTHEVPKTTFEGVRRCIAFDVALSLKG